MCLAIPGLVCEIVSDKRVMVDITGVRREADTSLLEEPLEVGDYVLVHTGFIISKLDPDQAKEDLKLWDEDSERIKLSLVFAYCYREISNKLNRFTLLYHLSMVLREKDANAQILRNFIDFFNKPNQYFLTNLRRSIPDILDDHECSGEAKSKVGVIEGIKLLRRKYKLNNIDVSYILVLISRGFKFRIITERVFLCEEKAINPSFEYFTPVKPRISDNFDTKTMVLNAIAECQDKDNEEIAQSLVDAIPEILERAYGVRYTGRFLSISQWLELKEKEGTWTSEEALSFKDYTIAPWMIGNLLTLQVRGLYLQEIPEKFKGNDYIFIKK